MAPRISIVLPTYNGSRWLADSIESVLSQTEQDWELIIVNDCSTDNTLEIAERYARRDDRIRVFSNAINKKLPASLNLGFSRAAGEYWTWTSDDNMFKPTALAVMAAYLNSHPRTDLVSANMDFINEDGTFNMPFDQPWRKPEHLSYENNVRAAFMYRATMAEKVGDYDEEFFCAEDYDYWCRIALAGIIDYIDDNIYLYRESAQSLTATQKDRAMEKAARIRSKYRERFAEKFKLTWWQREKMAYLIDKSKFRPSFIFFWMRRRVVEFFLGFFFCWNPKVRRRLRRVTSLKI